MVGDVGCKRIHKEKCKVFIHSPRKETGMEWRDIPALRGGGFELLWDYKWIKKDWGGYCCEAPGQLGCCKARLQFAPLLSSTCGCREWSVSSVLAFQ